MEQLRNIAKDLLTNKTVDIIIGFKEGSSGKVRPCFIDKPEDTQQLLFDERCRHNLAIYLLKHEIKASGKPAVVANIGTLRAILQLAAENQIKDGAVRMLTVTNDNTVAELTDLKSAQDYVHKLQLEIPAADAAAIKKIEAMSREERFAFWREELARCIKCYACRASCPMCYCNRCTVECNQPQWVPVAAHEQGNLEWHLMRAMHLAGRCVSCGECGRACPLDIPIHLLTMKVAEDVEREFGERAGISTELTFALSNFKTQDKETFIG